MLRNPSIFGGKFTPNKLPSLAAWYRLNQGITVATGASAWADASGNGRNIVQATGSLQPAVQGDGSLLFDGVDDFMQIAFTLVQPCTVYLRMKHIAWTVGNRISDGFSANGGAILQNGSTPQIQTFAGTLTGVNGNLALNTYGSVAAVFNGASSASQVDNTAAITGDAGAASMNGLTLGANASGAQPTNMQVKEVIVYSAAHDQATRDRVIAYLSTL